MNFLHPAIRFDPTIYVTSDSLGSNLILNLTSSIEIADPHHPPDLIDALTKAGEHATAVALLKRAGDWRLMTAEEVATFRIRRR